MWQSRNQSPCWFVVSEERSFYPVSASARSGDFSEWPTGRVNIRVPVGRHDVGLFFYFVANCKNCKRNSRFCFISRVPICRCVFTRDWGLLTCGIYWRSIYLVFTVMSFKNYSMYKWSGAVFLEEKLLDKLWEILHAPLDILGKVKEGYPFL